ncbi:MAG: hypothetical protein R6U96_18320 [Promethearchaeia archaeon]
MARIKESAGLALILTVSYYLVISLEFGSLLIMHKNRGINNYKQLGADKKKKRRLIW